MSDIFKVHFIGIGGVGMSGIALVAHARGMKVTGSDMKESRTTRACSKAGIRVSIGHDAANVDPDTDIVVISTAIPDKNPELAYARKSGITVWHRSRMLAALGKGKKTLACAGTHGKTTSSSMLATMVDRMGLDPSFLIGGTVDGYNTNAKSGDGEYYIVEADESDGSFVHLSPYVALVTNIEPDHLDHYGSLDAIYDAFADFFALVPDDGACVVCADNPRIAELAHGVGARCITYGEKPPAAGAAAGAVPAVAAGAAAAPATGGTATGGTATGGPATGGTIPDVTFEVTGKSGIGHSFNVTFPDGKVVEASISSNPGRHNVSNATGVLAVAWACGLDVEAAAAALSTFSGVRRRFDLVGEAGGIVVVDDYAHHPTEIAATLSAASELDFTHVHVLFQPHRYSRTADLAPLFGGAFAHADTVTVMDVYSAGEAPIPGINGKTVVTSILSENPRSQVAWMPHRREVAGYLRTKLAAGDLVITMGAGDVTGMGPEILAQVQAHEDALETHVGTLQAHEDALEAHEDAQVGAAQ